MMDRRLYRWASRGVNASYSGGVAAILLGASALAGGAATRGLTVSSVEVIEPVLLGLSVALFAAALSTLGLHALARAGANARERDPGTVEDPVTGLPDRPSFVRALDEHARAMRARGTGTAVCLVRACNLDMAAASLSPDEVRRVLRTQARRLDALCGGPLPVGRVRDDTFAFVVGGSNPQKRALDDAYAAVHALSKEIPLDESAFSPRVAAGIALLPEDASDPDEAVDKALAALAVSVQHGNRQVFLYSHSTQARVRDALELERALRDAVLERKLDLVYQPIVDAASGRTIGSEALVRWRHPVHGDVPPATFIPLAERCGLVTAIDRFVLEEAGRRTMAWRSKLAMPELFVSVNLSATQFRDAHLAGWIAGLLRSSFIDPSAVVLEVTETATLPDVEHGSTVVNQLRELGVRVALDDFGTGHSWLSYLSRIEVDRIKIDQAFVRDVHENPRHRAICEAIASLARGLSLSVVAEGVEREEHARCLRELGVHYLQGYHFAGPLTPERFAAFARQSRDRSVRALRGRGTRGSLPIGTS